MKITFEEIKSLDVPSGYFANLVASKRMKTPTPAMIEILKSLAATPCRDEDLKRSLDLHGLDVTGSYVTTCRKKLQRLGLVEEGEKTKSSNLKQCSCWKLTEMGGKVVEKASCKKFAHEWTVVIDDISNQRKIR